MSPSAPPSPAEARFGVAAALTAAALLLAGLRVAGVGVLPAIVPVLVALALGLTVDAGLRARSLGGHPSLDLLGELRVAGARTAAVALGAALPLLLGAAPVFGLAPLTVAVLTLGATHALPLRARPGRPACPGRPARYDGPTGGPR